MLNYRVWVVLFVLTALGTVGTVDDLMLPPKPVFTKTRAAARRKLAVQVLMSLWSAAAAARCWQLERRASRRSAGQCARCGYDLRATLLRCPECGAAAPASAR